MSTCTRIKNSKTFQNIGSHKRSIETEQISQMTIGESINEEYIKSQKRDHNRQMRKLITEFGSKTEKQTLERKLHRPLFQSKESQSVKDTMKAKSMRGLLARLEVSLHPKEKQAVIQLIANLSKTMNQIGNEKVETSKEIKHNIHIHNLQKHHLEHQILDESIEEDKIHMKEMELEKIMNLLIEEKERGSPF